MRMADRKNQQKVQTRSRRIEVKKSGVHGRGVYAARPLKAGETVLEYKGEIIT